MRLHKLIYTLAGAMFLLTASSVHAVTALSPDHHFALEVGSDITIVDSSGQPVLTLVSNTGGDTTIQVGWSPDSQHVVVVETSGRGTDIVAAWREASIWHRTIELDKDLAGVISQGQHDLGGRLVSDTRVLGGWISNTAVHIFGQMTFSGNRQYDYSYTLAFVHGPTTLSLGGYEDGAIVGRDYNIL